MRLSAINRLYWAWDIKLNYSWGLLRYQRNADNGHCKVTVY